MLGAETAERWEHTVPESIEDEWGDGEVETEVLHDAFLDEAGKLVSATGDADLVAVQGEISSGKTWLLTCLAEELPSRGESVTVLVPQKHNRRDVAERLRQLGVPSIPLPSRKDLCQWDEWRENVDRVDEDTCSSNGCELYPDEMGDVYRRANMVLEGDGTDLDLLPGPLSEEDLSHLAGEFCPAYFNMALAKLCEGRVRVATYAKVLQSGETAAELLSADVVLMDEGHGVAADMDVVSEELDALEASEAARRIADEAGRSLEVGDSCAALREFADALRGWYSDSTDEPVSPWALLEDAPELAKLSDALEEVEQELRGWINAHGPAKEGLEGRRRAYRDCRVVRQCVGVLGSFFSGNRDFVYVRYESQGETHIRLSFRLVGGASGGCGTEEVVEEMRENGLHPAVRKRWGGLLQRKVKECVEERRVVPGGERETAGTPPLPLEVLRDTLGADKVFAFSATHNAVSDPTLAPDEPRSTRHEIAVASPNLRSEGCGGEKYSGNKSVNAGTPWFRNMVEEAQEETDAELVAVPINKGNAKKWEGLPLRELEVPDGEGGTSTVPYLVPNSRGAHGSKDYESLEVDAVLCGCQVQSPGETASLLVELWNLLAPRYEDASEALDASCQLLAQRAVSPTIQAAGRFRQQATTVLFERPNLVELAGFEHEEATADMEGFVGALERRLLWAKEEYQRKKLVLNCRRVVGHLEKSEENNPTERQCLSKYMREFDATEEEAAEAFRVALEEGSVEYVAAQRRFRLPER